MQPQKERTTRKEQCFNRELGFSQWLRENLPNSYLPFFISDIDYVIYNGQSNSMMFLEVKHYNSQVQPWQRKLFNMMHSAVKKNVGLNMAFNYKGFNLITLEKTGFSDGWVKLNNKLITEIELIEFLSMHAAPPQWVGGCRK
jgi:hypothetical protein